MFLGKNMYAIQDNIKFSFVQLTKCDKNYKFDELDPKNGLLVDEMKAFPFFYSRLAKHARFFS